MKHLLVPAAVAAILAAFPAAGAVESYTVDPNHTFPSYEIGHFGYSIQRGRFNRTSGKILLDTAARKGSADVTIDTTSIDTGHPKLTEHLKSPDFFDVAKYPQMTLKAGNFTFEGDTLKSAAGDLTIHGVTRPVTFKAEAFRCAPHPMLKKMICGAELTTTIKRSEFGMDKYVPALADDVLLRVNVEAIKDD
jgi:polyisoprenoid-binding protein YceI